MDTLHKQVLTLLGFDVIFKPLEHHQAEKGEGWWSLCRGADVYRKGEPDGRARLHHSDMTADKYMAQHAPTLRDLRDAIEGAMVTDRYSVELFYNEGGYGAALVEGENDWVMVVQRKLTNNETIAALFIAACEAGLIDPSKAVL